MRPIRLLVLHLVGFIEHHVELKGHHKWASSGNGCLVFNTWDYAGKKDQAYIK